MITNLNYFIIFHRPHRRTHACGQAQHYGAGQYVTSYRKTAVDGALGIPFRNFRNHHVAVFHLAPNNLVNSVHPNVLLGLLGLYIYFLSYSHIHSYSIYYNKFFCKLQLTTYGRK